MNPNAAFPWQRERNLKNAKRFSDKLCVNSKQIEHFIDSDKMKNAQTEKQELISTVESVCNHHKT